MPKHILPFGYGLTLYKIVLVRKDAQDIDYAIAHEAKHVQQWQEHGFGYRNNRFEIEAREYGKQESRIKTC